MMEDSRLHDSEKGSTITPPTKRTRLCDVSTLNMSVKSMRRMSVYRTADALTILSTPTVTRERNRPLSPRRPPSTPQSILKVKQLIKDSVTKPAVGEKPFLDVSLNLEDTGSLTPRSREGTPGKSLRFKEPRRLPPGPGTSSPPPPPPLEG